MRYYDIHTHQPAAHADDIAILSINLRDPQNPLVKVTDFPKHYSIGIHPWHPDKRMMEKVIRYATQPAVVAIGETGLDKITAGSPETFKRQQELFTQHIRLSEETGKPLIIHCVKAWDELLHIRKATHPAVPWIIHGFRGKELLATQLLDAGLYLSFGSFYNPEALKAAWKRHHLLIETDDKQTNIREVYQQIASELKITVDLLSDEIGTIFKTKLLIT